MDLQTLHGIDACAERLATELKQYVAEHPGLQHLTVIGHSMGGLIARTLIGKRYIAWRRSAKPCRHQHMMALLTCRKGI